MNLLFDLDGTLTDSSPGIVACFQHAFSVLGHPIPSGKVIEAFIGAPLRYVFQQLLPPDCSEDGVNDAITHYRERFADVGLLENSVYDGIPEALLVASSHGADLFVVTSKPRVFAQRIVEHFNLAKHFQKVYGSELDGRLADKAELISHALSTSGLSAVDTVMIGDRKHDVHGALSNGVYPVGVLWGYGSQEELKLAGAEKLYQRPNELDELVI